MISHNTRYYECLYFVGFSGVWDGYLCLSNIPITHLPDNLVVGEDFILNDTPITHLPKNLKVGWCLDLERTKITHLPDNLEVGGSLWLFGSGIKKTGFKKPKGVKGFFYI